MLTNENNMKNTRYGTAGIIREVRWGNMDTGCFTTTHFFLLRNSRCPKLILGSWVNIFLLIETDVRKCVFLKYVSFP